MSGTATSSVGAGAAENYSNHASAEVQNSSPNANIAINIAATIAKWAAAFFVLSALAAGLLYGFKATDYLFIPFITGGLSFVVMLIAGIVDCCDHRQQRTMPSKKHASADRHISEPQRPPEVPKDTKPAATAGYDVHLNRFLTTHTPKLPSVSLSTQSFAFSQNNDNVPIIIGTLETINNCRTSWGIPSELITRIKNDHISCLDCICNIELRDQELSNAEGILKKILIPLFVKNNDVNQLTEAGQSLLKTGHRPLFVLPSTSNRSNRVIQQHVYSRFNSPPIIQKSHNIFLALDQPKNGIWMGYGALAECLMELREVIQKGQQPAAPAT